MWGNKAEGRLAAARAKPFPNLLERGLADFSHYPISRSTVPIVLLQGFAAGLLGPQIVDELEWLRES